MRSAHRRRLLGRWSLVLAVGLVNLGGKWTDGTGMNENGFVIDGQLTKIHEEGVRRS